MSTNVKGFWTKEELAEAHRLRESCQADAGHWAFADWLLAKEPVKPDRHVQDGTYRRLGALAEELDWSRYSLLRLRETANAWPKKHRVVDASFNAHQIYAHGGAPEAPKRSARLAALPRDRFGKVRTASLPRAFRSGRSLKCSDETYDAIAMEARATGGSLSGTMAELVNEALEARVWLASEVAA